MIRARLIVTAVVLTAIAAFVIGLGPPPRSVDPLAASALSFGLLLLFAFTAGQLALTLGAPKISGYLLAGIMVGPHALGLVTAADAEPLRLVNGLALSLIAFTAGGELKIERFRPRLKAVGLAAAGQFAWVFTIVFLLFFPALYFSQLLGPAAATALCGALLLAVIATANSPATAVAVITETRSRGPVSDTVLGVTVIKDVMVVVIFGVALALAEALSGAQEGVGLGTALDVFHDIVLSLVIGTVAGAVIIGYLRLTDENVGLFIVGAALMVAEVCQLVGADALLVSIGAGFAVENFSRSGEKLIRGIETSSAPVYVIFFSLAGLGLDLPSLHALWPYAVALALARMAGMWAGTVRGLRRAGEPEQVGRRAWTGFIGQAGVSVGFAVIVGQRFPEWGPTLGALVLAGVVINQLAGPIMMKRSLTLAGETGAQEPFDSNSASVAPVNGK